MITIKTFINLFKIPLIVFLVLILSISILGIEIKSYFSEYVGEFEPIEDALESKRIDLYLDSILLYKYLATNKISEMKEIDDAISESNHKCTMIDTKMSTFNEEQLLREELFKSYQNALDEHKKAERIKENIIESHKEYLISGSKYNEVEILEQYNFHFNNALSSIETELNNLSIKKIELRKRISMIEVTIVTLIFFLSLLFTYFLITSILRIKKDLIEPFESIDKNTKEFVEGDFKSMVNTNSSKPEVRELEDRINNIFSYVRENTIGDSKKKRHFREHFLKTEYHEILEFLKEREMKSMATSMKDLKKILRITHPTLISRLKYLEKHSYITIKKNGRDKIINLIN